MDYVTLLLVDDDVDLLRLLQRRLESDGFDTIAVEGGRQARIALERRLPDLAIVDILMPEMDGFEVAEMIKQRGDIPIIFLTSVGKTKTRIEAIRSFAEDYVIKPFNYQELLARVQRILRRTAGSVAIHEPLVLVDQDLSLDFGKSMAHSPRCSKIVSHRGQNPLSPRAQCRADVAGEHPRGPHLGLRRRDRSRGPARSHLSPPPQNRA